MNRTREGHSKGHEKEVAVPGLAGSQALGLVSGKRAIAVQGGGWTRGGVDPSCGARGSQERGLSKPRPALRGGRLSAPKVSARERKRQFLLKGPA